MNFSAKAKRRRRGWTCPQFGVRPEHRRDRIALLEPILQETSDIAGIELRQPVEFQGRHTPLARFYLGHGGARNPKDSRGLRLGDVTGLPRGPETSSEVELGNRHQVASHGWSRRVRGWKRLLIGRNMAITA